MNEFNFSLQPGKKEYKKLFFIDYEQKKLKNLCVFS